MEDFQKRYNQLNENQKKAVDSIEGPVLVVAGPGSGKTELLSLRIASILQETDTMPQNVLSLTFTDSAAVNMRERLSGLIGVDAFKTSIHTFHNFCVDIINRYPEYFYKGAIFKAADEVTQFEILDGIFNAMPHSNPLSVTHPEQGYVFLKDSKRAITTLKQGGLVPDELEAIVKHNEEALEKINPLINEAFNERISKKSINKVEDLLSSLDSIEVNGFPVKNFKSIIEVVKDSLTIALNESKDNNSTTIALNESKDNNSTPHISNWKTAWVKTDEDSEMKVLKDFKYIEKMKALVEVYKEYREEMFKRGFYDFDDMLLDVIHALENNLDIRLDLQERFLYILVDEFQDTNNAQMRLIHLLTDSEVAEGRPNIMAVGDDDQAIYKFQGAEISNILDFKNHYRDPEIITLVHNYRSTQDIIDTAHDVISQGELRLENLLPEVEKDLKAANKERVQGEIHHKAFETQLHEFQWIAQEIKKLIDGGRDPQEISVISRKHSHLESLTTFLNSVGVPFQYERKQDVFTQPHIYQLIQMSRFIISLGRKKVREADEYLPEILSFPFWGLERTVVWDISVKARKEKKLWLEIMGESDDPKLVDIANFFKTLAADAQSKPLEYVLDDIISSKGLTLNENIGDTDTRMNENKNNSKKHTTSFKEFYFSKEKYKEQTSEYIQFLSGLRVFVQALREYRGGLHLKLDDLVTYVDSHQDHGIKLTDKSAFINNPKAVSLLTAHKAKGREFEVVFVLSTQNDVWATSHSRNILPFPINLPIMPSRDNKDDQLRLFYVAITRAKTHLYLTSYEYAETGKESQRVQFLANSEVSKSTVDSITSADALELSWQGYHLTPVHNDEKALLAPLVENYHMSVTHLNNFLNIIYGGPQAFLEQNLLRFPQPKSPSGAYGTAIHNAIEQIYLTLKNSKELPSDEKALEFFEKELKAQGLDEGDFKFYLEKGRDSFSQFYKAKKDSFDPEDLTEFDFRQEGVVIGEAQLAGKIDRMKKVSDDEMVVYDYKTGKAADKWIDSEVKLINYRRQLLFYKILVEHSKDFGGKFKVHKGVLEFVEPKGSKIVDLELVMEDSEIERLKKLIEVVYQKIINLDFPDISKYSKDVKGIKEFEEDLLTSDI